jgi:hypothetical protein
MPLNFVIIIIIITILTTTVIIISITIIMLITVSSPSLSSQCMVKSFFIAPGAFIYSCVDGDLLSASGRGSRGKESDSVHPQLGETGLLSAV